MKMKGSIQDSQSNNAINSQSTHTGIGAVTSHTQEENTTNYSAFSPINLDGKQDMLAQTNSNYEIQNCQAQNKVER